MAEQSPRKPSRARKIIIGSVAVLAVLILVVVLAGPTIAGSFVPGIIAGAAKDQIRGGVKVDKVALSWTGSQKITGLRLTDPDAGGAVVTMNGTLDRGLIGLITNPNDLGTLRLDGNVDIVEAATGGSNLARAIEPPAGAPAKPSKGAAPSSSAGPSKPIRVPKGLKVKLEGRNLKGTYTTTDASGAKAVYGLTNITIDGGVDGADATLTATGDALAGGRTLDVKAEAIGLIGPDGAVDPAKARISASIVGSAPQGLIEAILGVVTDAGESAGLKVDINVEGRDGRAHLSGDKPSTIQAILPGAIFQPDLGPDAPASLTLSGTTAATLEISKLDVPLPGSNGYETTDWRKSQVQVALRTGSVSGQLTDKNGTRAVELEPTTATLYSANDEFDLGLIAQTALSFDGVSTGVINVDVKSIGNTNRQDGTLRLSGVGGPAGPDFIRGQIVAQSIPTALLQPFLAGTNVDLVEAFGPSIQLDVRAGQMGAEAASSAVKLDKVLGQPGAAKELAGLPYISGTLDSQETTAYFDAYLASAGLRTRNNGIKIETDALGAIARRFLPKDTGLEFQGQGKGIVELTNVEIPLSGGGVDLRGARGSYRVIGGDLLALVNGTAIDTDSVDVQVDLAPGAPPAWALDARGQFQGSKFAALGKGTIPGLMAPQGATDAVLGMTPATARPEGEITLIDIPTGLAKLAGADTARLAESAFGDKIRGVIKSTAASGKAIDVNVDLSGSTATILGAATVRSDSIEIGKDGITATFAQPGALLTALNGSSGNSRVSFSPGGRVMLTAHDVSAPLTGGLNPRSIGAGIDVNISELIGTAHKPDGSTVPFSIVDGVVSATLAKGGSFDASTKITGTAAGNQTVITGGAKGVIPEASEPMAAVKAIEQASLEARGVPTALLGVFDERTAAMAMEAAGDTVDLIVAPTSATEKAWDVKLTGRDLAVNSGFRLDRDAWAVGPTTGSIVVTPALVDAVAGEALASMNPRPRLQGPVGAEINAERFRIGPGPDGWGLTTGETLSVRGSLKGDAIARDVASLGSGKSASVGLRNTEFNASIDGAGSGGARVSALVFQPDSGAPVASVAGTVKLPTEPLVGEVHVSDGDVAALDSMLGMDGLLVDALGASLGADAELQGAGGAVTAQVKSPRLTADATLSRTADGGMSLKSPLKANWKAGPKAIDRLVLGVQPGSQGDVHATGDVDAQITLDRLTLGPTATPLKPGVFDLSGAIQTSKLALKKSTGEALEFPAVAGTVKSDPSTRGVSFQLASAPGEASAVKVVGRVDSLANAEGKIDADAARVTADIDGKVPSALLDAVGSTGGMLAALAGPAVAVDATAKNLGRTAVGGTVDANITADYATAKLAGEVTAPNLMRVADGSELRINRITPEASAEILSVLVPFLTSFEKSDEDKPASVVLTGFEAPLDGDTKKLNGTMVVDLGTMRFQTKSFFSKLLKAIKQKDAGRVGNRIEPVTFNITNGVAKYEKMIVPTGEFSMESYGKINLNKKTLDIYVLVPFYALAEEAASVVSKVPGLDRLASVPISIKGPFDSPETKIDLEEMIKKAPSNIGQGVGGLLEGTIGNLLGGDKDKSSDDKKSEDKKSDDGGKKKKKKNGGG